MTFQMYLISTMIMLFCIGAALECPQRNTSCSDIKTTDGFRFLHADPEGCEIFVYYNKFSNEVMSMDNDSVITRDCRDLQVNYIVPDGEQYVKETCVYYKITETEQMKNPDPTDLRTFGLIFLIPWIMLIGIGLCYMLRKKKVNFSRYLQTCFRKGISQAEMGETEETRLSEMPSATVPCGSGENDFEQDITLGSVHVHSNDPKDDGKTPQSLILDRNLSNEEIQPSKNGDISAPDVNKASNYRAMHRNTRDDPGGVNNSKGNDIVRFRKKPNGWTLEDCGPEDPENEGQTLLLSERAATQEIDKTGEAAALVYKRGFDPDQVSRCSTAQDTDVESTHNMKN